LGRNSLTSLIKNQRKIFKKTNKKNKKMILQIKNKDLFFVVESIWNSLDYRFKFQINEKVTANPGDEFVQNIEIDVATLMQCYEAISSKAYGCTVNAADILLDEIRDQLLENIEDQEYEEAISKFLEMKIKDDTLYENKCLSGKESILK
jgi:hypothetical protein